MATSNVEQPSRLRRSMSLGAFGLFLPGRDPNPQANDWWATMLSSAADIRLLKETSGLLTQQDEPLLDPEVFLASLSKGWRPKVVCVFSANALVGILYTKERVISGIPTGIVYADGSLGGFLLANAIRQQNALSTALEALLASPGIRGVHLRMLQNSGESDSIARLILSRSFDVRSIPIEYGSHLWKHHAHLSLPDTYSRFLDRLGNSTRHNFRYYRKRFEVSGHQFLDALALDDLRDAMLRLQPNSKFHAEAPSECIEQHFGMVAGSRRPLAIGLKHRNGEWLSVAGGWYRPGGAVLIFQFNKDLDFGRDSLSTVLRSYLIELLIQRGMPELVIWADTGPPLSRYVSYPPTIGIRLDVPTPSWRMARMLISTIGPHLPRRWANAAQWLC
jgi:hypothetical protein